MTFLRPTLAQLIERVRNDLLPTQSVLARASFEGRVAMTLAGLAHGIHGHLVALSRELLPDTSGPDGVTRWARMLQMDFRPAARATGSVIFPSPGNVFLPIGTLAKSPSGLEYEVIEALAGGGQSIANFRALEFGRIGNLAFDPLADTTITLSSPVAGVDSAGVLQSPGFSGGADVETVEELRERVLERFAVNAEGPGYHASVARDVTAIAKAWEQATPGSGLITIYIMEGVIGGNEIVAPNATKISEVQDYVVERTAVTRTISVQAPTIQTLDLTIALTIESTAEVADVQAEVTKEITSFLTRDAEPGVNVAKSRISEAIARAAGEKSHAITLPAGDTVVASSSAHLIQLGTITFP